MSAQVIALTPTVRAERAETRLEAYRRKVKSIQGGAEEVTERMTGAMVTVGGGVFAGVIWSKFGNGTPGSAKIGETQLEIDTLIGTGLVLAAAFGMAGKHSAELGTFGGGMLAARAAAFIGRVMEEHEQKAKAA
jgi:hypothetical protein